MKNLGRFLLVGLIAVILLLTVLISISIGWRPFLGPRSRPLTSVKFESTPRRLERGKYLFTVTGCISCHSPHDTTQNGFPAMAGKEGSGEVMPFDGLPGRIVAPNLTPDPETGTGKWTDDQIARAVREGIGHDGRTLFPMMPYDHYRRMSDEDLASVVVYIRSLPPIPNQLPKTEIKFPVNYLIRAVPQPVTAPVASPDTGNQVKRGEYLVNLGGCSFCHTPQDHGQVVEGMDYEGGQMFSAMGTSAASANITPDPSGISYYDEALFFQALRTGYVKARKLNSIMPFAEYRTMTDDDLKDVFAFLHTLKPVKHHVDNSEPPTFCKLCRQTHGGGDKN
jgi:mono/diheme cytochrome c family protein